MKRRTCRSYFFAKSLLSRLKSKDAEDEIIHFWRVGVRQKALQSEAASNCSYISAQVATTEASNTQASLTPVPCCQELL